MKNKNVLLITFHATHNYGAVLQAYALQQKIDEAGADCKIIDLRTREETAKNNIFKKTKTFNGIMKNILSLFFLRSLRRKYKNFENFINTRLKLTPETYQTTAELARANLKADIFLTGSDQAWNYKIFGAETAYFLSFTDSENKAAFSPSIGKGANLPDGKLRAAITSSLKNYKLISVRDFVSRDFVSSLTGKTPLVTADPTLLLDAAAWDKIAAPVKYNFKYILFYVIKNDAHFYDMARKAAAFFKLPVIVTTLSSRHDFGTHFKRDFSAGPREFLSLIKNAEMVLTSSMHGTIFSILYKKPFLTFDGMKDERISALFNELGLESRAVTTENIDSALAGIYKTDFASAFEKLEAYRRRSLDFLSKILNI